ncbi:unnamed protein product [Brassicogethes aeneus]|uniref:ODAD1 central coiled coil region domain-containing protein n=1 Tax=Brassicogethes aeneus TaxID=1431903 RepID=A0A9P0FGG8_BRAAE|nr:unnamed protein product [Brassicogethes aeneus]
MSNQAATEKEMTTMAEEELSRLQRQLRIMEEDRMAYADEARIKLERQRKFIKVLREEKSKIEEDLRVATCKSHAKKDWKYAKSVEGLLIKHKKYCNEIDEYKSEIRAIDDQHKKVEAQIKKLRLENLVSEDEYQYRIKSGNNSVKCLENRLENTVKKFCNTIVDNKDLREEIDHLLVERCQFNYTWEQLLQDLKYGKKLMMDLIDQATLAYDQREEWSSKLEALKKRADQDLEVHTEEMREIKRKLDHDNRLKDFLCIKGQKRILRDLEEKERIKREVEEQCMADQLKTYEETLRQIRSYCDEENVDRMAALYVKQEEENFALFNYVNELSHEIEEYETINENLAEKIEEQKKLAEERAKDSNITVDNLEVELTEAKKTAIKAEEEFKTTENRIKMVLGGILEVFAMLKCERGPILELLQDEEVNFQNAMFYLGNIDKKVTELLYSMHNMSKTIKK